MDVSFRMKGCERVYRQDTSTVEPLADMLFCLEDMIQAKGSSHHPLGQLAYRIISGNTWYDSQYVLMDQKVSLPPLFPFRIANLNLM